MPMQEPTNEAQALEFADKIMHEWYVLRQEKAANDKAKTDERWQAWRKLREKTAPFAAVKPKAKVKK